MFYNSSQDITYFKLPNDLNRTYDFVLKDKYDISILKQELSRAMVNFTKMTTTPLTIIIYKDNFSIMNMLLKISMVILLLAILSFLIYFIYNRHYFIKKKPNDSIHDHRTILTHTGTEMERVREK